jgi:hypothetical protein
MHGRRRDHRLEIRTRVEIGEDTDAIKRDYLIVKLFRRKFRGDLIDYRIAERTVIF